MRAGQDFYQQPITRLVDAVVTAYQENPGMHLEVFVHKADVLSDEYKIGVCLALRRADVSLMRCRELPADTAARDGRADRHVARV